jgi:peptidoglycan/LPS O-acetylase OafA/YrhL
MLRNQAARRWIPAWCFPILLAFEIVLLFDRPPFFSTLQATVIPLLILSTVLHPGSIPGRLLEMKAVRWIGWISYSLYLWQQLFFGDNFVSSPPRLAALREWPLNLFVLMVCAGFSYHMVEKPFIRLGHKISLAIANSHAAKRAAQPLHQPPEAATSSRVFMRS